MRLQRGLINAQFSHSMTGAVFIAPTATATVSSSPRNGGGLDPAIVAAIIGACIASIFGILGIAFKILTTGVE